jgi:hypothetical protein
VVLIIARTESAKFVTIRSGLPSPFQVGDGEGFGRRIRAEDLLRGQTAVSQRRAR